MKKKLRAASQAQTKFTGSYKIKECNKRIYKKGSWLLLAVVYTTN